MKNDTIIRTILLAIALVNQALTMSGKNPLPWSEDDVYTLLSNMFTFCASAWAWWKNNSFTWEAQEADMYMEQLREGEQ